MDTPECDKKAAVGQDWSAIVQFFEWAQDKGYHFTRSQTFIETGTRMHSGEEYEYEVRGEVPIRVEDALYEFFEIDPNKVEQERRALLAEAHAANERYRDTYTVHPAPEES